MAKITLFNTREHDITLSARGKEGESGFSSVTIPAARQNADDPKKFDLGQEVVDDSFLSAAKKSPVVAHYFEEGWLKTKADKKVASADDDTTDKDKAKAKA